MPNSLMNPTYSEAFVGPQADDIAGARALYGVAPIVTTVPEPGSSALVFALSPGIAVAGITVRRRYAVYPGSLP